MNNKPAKPAITLVSAADRHADYRRLRAALSEATDAGQAFGWCVLTFLGAVFTAVALAQGEPITIEPSWWSLLILSAMVVVTGVSWWRKGNAAVDMLDEVGPS